MTMVESLASGKPVIAFGRGGALEIVRDKCGVLYHDASEAGLTEALKSFDRIEPSVNPLYLRSSAERFSEETFERDFRAALKRLQQPAPEFTTTLQVPHDTRSARQI